MNLHESPDVFQEFIQRTAIAYSIPEVYVEKDYWVTLALKRLSESEFADQVVFKGGTALSKAHNLIQRFSEDIDLAAKCTELSQNDTRRLLKGAGNAMTVDLEYQPKHPRESKHGKFRKTVHAYPTNRQNEDFGQVAHVILLEINAFSEPEPSEEKPISSLINSLLQDEGHHDVVDRYQLQDFSLDILSVERTLCEKVMGLVRACYEDDAIAALRRRIRHIYDICMIMRNAKYQAFAKSDDFKALMTRVRTADQALFQDAKKWLVAPAHEAIVFAKPIETWGSLSSEFHGDFRQMVFNDDLPSDDEVVNTLKNLRGQLQSNAPH